MGTEHRIFGNRQEAGRLLAQQLTPYKGRQDVIVIAVPRGGVPVGYEVAQMLRVSFDILVVRKLGVPRLPEIAMGAIAEGGVRVLNEDVIFPLAISGGAIEAVERVETQELLRRMKLYRGERPVREVAGKTVILVDDGVATGMTLRAARAALCKRNPARVVVAVPVAPHDIWPELKKEFDEGICLFLPQPFLAVGAWYEDFSNPGDAEIRSLLAQASEVVNAKETGV